jgi:hypothetical protein
MKSSITTPALETRITDAPEMEEGGNILNILPIKHQKIHQRTGEEDLWDATLYVEAKACPVHGATFQYRWIIQENELAAEPQLWEWGACVETDVEAHFDVLIKALADAERRCGSLRNCVLDLVSSSSDFLTELAEHMKEDGKPRYDIESVWPNFTEYFAELHSVDTYLVKPADGEAILHGDWCMSLKDENGN